jgi:hypothetical protein
MPADRIGAATKKGPRHVLLGSSAVKLHHFFKLAKEGMSAIDAVDGSSTGA